MTPRSWARPRRMLLVANPVARTVSRPVLDVIEKAFAADFEVVVDETTRQDHATEIARQAVAEGFDMMVVFSGDGTVNEAVNGLAGGDVALGVLPGGATNVLARAVGMPQDPVEATGVLIGAAVEGRATRIALGSADGRRFAINCGVGIDADAMARVDERRAKSRAQFERAALGAVLKLAVGTYAGMKPFLEVSVDGRPATAAVSVVAGRTNPYSYFRNLGLRLTPQAALDDGLDVTTLLRLNRRSMPRLARQVFSGSIVKRKDVDYVHGASSVEVVGTRPFPVQMDGDYLGTRERLSIGLEGDALWLVA